MKHSSIPLAQSVIAHCKAYRIKHVVISPGSRSAPLTIGFTNDPFFECYSIVDERCAAFFALGIAQQLGIPVALVCTSGSALLNYYPAVSEAYFSHIPLVVLSADRPEHLIGIGDGQTIFQENVFKNHSFYNANLKSGENKEILKANEVQIKKALSKAIKNAGPVHINLPFNEPLYNTVDQLQIDEPAADDLLLEDEVPVAQLKRFQESWYPAKRKMILVGVLDPDSISHKLIEAMAADPALLVFTETTSNLHADNFFPSIDQIIAPLDEADFSALQPDVLLTFGGMIISKKIKAFLRKYAPKAHWHIGPFEANDTFFCLTEHAKTQPETFLEKVLEGQNAYVESDYQSHWLRIKAHRLKKHQSYMENLPFSDFLAFHSILEHFPKHVNVQMGNSSAIRYAQLFKWHESVTMFCNRGTSGIDGSTSTAIGAAAVSETPTILITGDLSFFYDSNALWNNYIPHNFKIILLNNGGGGIFRILPGHKNTENFDRFFETKHELNAVQLCLMFGFQYTIANSRKELEEALPSFFENHSRPSLLEIKTPSRINDEVLLRYFNEIK
jgi:2-succinyl-5-enolpyruvyl-6-hydroxy-3-cyclohexene-1-carboxylate synthase